MTSKMIAVAALGVICAAVVAVAQGMEGAHRTPAGSVAYVCIDVGALLPGCHEVPQAALCAKVRGEWPVVDAACGP
jgi:hypothetical protein